MHALPRRGDVSNPWVREGNLYADFVVQAIWLLAFLGHRVIVRASVSSRLWLYPKMKDVIQRCGGVKAFVQMCDMGHEQKKGTHLYGFNVPWLPTMQAGRLLAPYPFRYPPYVFLMAFRIPSRCSLEDMIVRRWRNGFGRGDPVGVTSPEKLEPPTKRPRRTLPGAPDQERGCMRMRRRGRGMRFQDYVRT